MVKKRDMWAGGIGISAYERCTLIITGLKAEIAALTHQKNEEKKRLAIAEKQVLSFFDSDKYPLTRKPIQAGMRALFKSVKELKL